MQAIKTNLLLFLTALLTFAGCTDDFDNSSGIVPSLEPRYLTISQTSFGSSLPDAFSDYAYVRSMQTPWKFTGVPAWFSVKPSSGTTDAEITLTAEENTSADNARTSIFYLESTLPEWKLSKPLTVSQGVAKPGVSIPVTAIEFGGSGATESLEISANCQWKAIYDAGWITVTPGVNSLSVTAVANPTANYRQATIAIMTSDERTTLATIQATQAPAKVEASATTLTFENVASSYELDLNAEADWTSEVSASWIQISPDNGPKGATKVNVEVSPNTSVSQRTGYVTFSTGTAKKLEIKIVQKGIYIDVSEYSLRFSSLSSEQKLKVSSNTSWEVQSLPDWLKVTPASGNGDTEVSVRVEENLSSASRSGEIVFGQEGLSLSSSVGITQAGKTVTPEADHLEFSDKASSRTFTIGGDAPWKASTEDDWITLSPVAGTGAGSITGAGTENPTTLPRRGKITISFLDREIIIEVTQEAKYINVEAASFNYPSTGGTNLLNVSTNDTWVLKKETAAPWLIISPESGSGEMDVTITAEDNPSVNPRSCIVTLDTQYLQDVEFTISQKARYLTLSAQNILFFTKGGTSDPITVETDGKYAVTTEASWIEINRTTENTFTVTAAENTTEEIRRAVVTVALTDLKEGKLVVEIPVMQYTNGSSF
ncbi:MAG: hypothetical protein K2J48_02525, partial [Muribaculaceae bacterium]|nr:hypothetical protein [Muribaculaceae bacterium]